MHVASLVFVGRGGYQNSTKKRTPGLLELHQEAHSREAQTAACAKSSRWCVLWDILRTLKSGIGACIRLLQGSQLPVRWLSRIRFEGVKADKSYNPAHTRKVRHVAPSYDTSMSSPDREESNAGLFENWRVL